MKIYTSFHKAKPNFFFGPQIGESISISQKPPEEFKGIHLKLFAPSDKLLKTWYSSKKDAIAEQEYTEIFLQEMSEKSDLINIWLNKLTGDVTLNCFESPGKFCHRHLVGQIIRERRPELWGGEVSELKIDAQSPIPDTQPLTPDPSIFEWLEREGIKLYEPTPLQPQGWRVNVGQYALYAGELVKIVGGDKTGKWQVEKSPKSDPNQTLPQFNQWAKTSALSQPPEGHETWTDADFKKARNKAKAQSNLVHAN